MLDLRTLWLLTAEDRYEPEEAMRRAERAVYPLLRKTDAPVRAPARGPAAFADRAV
jgi:hypothetical protein